MSSKIHHISIPDIITNREDVYEGDLVHYFRIIFRDAGNLQNPYHNLRHMLHVLWLCYDACLYYSDQLTTQEMRELLIAALFHDFDHSGHVGNDKEEIAQAITGVKTHLLSRNSESLAHIIDLIESTEHPHRKTENESLQTLILRDADTAQALSPAWIQQIILNLGREMQRSPQDMIEGQIEFLSNLPLVTAWAKDRFSDERDAKIAEVRSLLEILEE